MVKFLQQKMSNSAKISHLGIGAHPDDLEFMAFHGISKCYKSKKKNFAGIICTAGAGSSRHGKFKKLSETEFINLRNQEQLKAAKLGNYAFLKLLGYKSKKILANENHNLLKDLAKILLKAKPKVIYTHNPFDKHPTHVAVLKHVINTLKNLSLNYGYMPEKLWGCELWRGLDWLNDQNKKCFDVSKNKKLLKKLCRVFKSQIYKNKNYDQALRGRLKANASFLDFKNKDSASHIIYAIDLLPLIHNDDLSLEKFAQKHLHNFEYDVLKCFLE